MALAPLVACGETQSTATRLNTGPALFQSGSFDAALLDEQATSLTRLADDMVRKSTGKGAMIGAAVGCGLAIATASSAQDCVVGAAAGGISGALMGRTYGNKQLEKRIAQVNASDMVKSIRRNNSALDEVAQTLPGILAQQDAELAQLKREQEAGTMSEARYEKRVAAIRDARAKLALALTDSAHKARLSAQNLGAAAKNGQPGLGWHIGAAKRIEQQALSTRARISLL
ncbi:MAG: hypothetical protein CSA70_07705 [Rhodobacterales bacterium]|nr:MAG: hypothetical protein CSA70_07705 [Rhodobacterales bacterium]